MRHRALVSAIALLAVTCSAVAAPMIVGGDDAAFQDFPYQVRVQVRLGGGDVGDCGGSLIGRTWILTAAHCVTRIEANPVPYAAYQVDVLSGSAKVSELVKSTVHRVYVHPGWHPNQPPQLQNDIAILELEAPLAGMHPIKLASAGTPQPARITVSGWGQTSNNPNSDAGTLQKVTIDTVSNSVCAAADVGDITDGMMCAGGQGKGICHGDSGGPATTPEPNWADRTQVGIVSRLGELGDTNCGEQGKYDVYTRVSAYRAWIDAVITPQAPPVSGDRYVIINLGKFMLPQAINNGGLVAGYENNGRSVFIIEAYRANKRSWPVPLPGNVAALRVLGISNSGRVLISGSLVGSPNGRLDFSYVTGPEGASPVTDILARYPGTTPAGITSDGRIFGGKGGHFFITEPEVGALRDLALPTFQYPGFIGATGGNSGGQVTGAAGGQVFISGPNGANLRSLGPGTLGRINENGEVVASLITGKENKTNSFLIGQDGQTKINLGTCGTNGQSFAHAINNFGVTVGQCDAPGATALNPTGAVSTGGAASRKLVEVTGLLDGPGYRNFVLTSINDRGQIVGWARIEGVTDYWNGIVLDPVRYDNAPPATP